MKIALELSCKDPSTHLQVANIQTNCGEKGFEITGLQLQQGKKFLQGCLL